MDDREVLHRWIQAWEEAGPQLEAIRREEIRTADNREVLASLESAFNHATRSLPPRESSGLIEMQRWFAKLRTCSAEDLIVLKLFASRPLDIRDAEGVVLRNKEALDWRYIKSQLDPFAEVKGQRDILDALDRLRQL